ncbi:Uncharacterized conserved protein YkwD, contains CAP (CSP/antigen 5/PR1) domain [Geodermatophilus saharensis]|uniref:Uncharacterized conserved protein YkwD, contains CAP (CSP/antigen 5/PR1) domain n=1 Tax=Geodermatophilus saharensis TaxID=1137994 RepID=A0A238ZVH7_9ACTN|nr:CAP domain-containing protein [Geodermatophilus saharensis]SNR87122.1 Uncharacterized conserved protein YkwD, contains CAP (CSP/antigen 5/PR1) domain [Geodermatophilus saharensis]
MLRVLLGRRVLPVLLVAVVVGGIVLAVPLMAAGRGALSTAESGVTSAAGEPGPRTGVVTMGVDGEPVAPGVPGAAETTGSGPSTGASPQGTADGTAPGARSPEGSAAAGAPTEDATTEGSSAAGPSSGGDSPTQESSTAGSPSSAGSSSAGSSPAGSSSAEAPSGGPSSAGAPSAGSSSAGSSSGGSSSAASSAGSSSAGSSAAGSPSAARTTTQAPASARSAPAPQTSAPASSGTEAAVLELVNQARAAAGCGAVRADAALAAVARAHSADMRDRGYFSHTTPEGLSPFDRAEAAGITHARAENIAYGQPDPAAVMDAWMNSAGHRANILNCSLSTLGVGVADGPGGPWWTQLFGA